MCLKFFYQSECDCYCDLVVLTSKFYTGIFLLTLRYLKSVFLSLDDGGGMDPVAMRRCMSFGFSDKNSKSAIGQCMNSSNHSTVSCDYLLPYLLLYL